MKIVIIGCGGVGGYFGGCLAKAGNNVTFVARGENYNALKKEGITVKSINGDFRIDSVNVVQSVSEIRDPELIIIAVKAWQVKNIAKEIKPVLIENTLVLPLQNGVLAAEELKEVLGVDHVLPGLCRILSKIEKPGHINHMGVTPTIVFGEVDNVIRERTKNIDEIFKKSGFESKIAKDIHAEIWKKFISICTSGLLAVCNGSYGEVRENPETRKLMEELLAEIYQVSQNAGIKIDALFVKKTMSFIDTFPFNSTSSLTRDVWNGKPSEIEYQNGTVVRLGQKYGVPTPVNRFVYASILISENKARKNS